MSEVPSVNERPAPVPESESAGVSWVDPAFAERHTQRLPDEVALGVTSMVEPSEAEPQPQPGDAEKAKLTPEQLKALVDANPEEGEGEEGEEGKPKAEEVEKAEPQEAADEEDEGAAEADDGKTPKREDSRERRRKRREQERAQRLRELEAENAMLRAQQQPKDPKAEEAAESPAERPKIEDFDYDAEKWSEAFAKWTQDQLDAGKKAAEEAKAAEQRKAEDDRRKANIQAFRDREEEIRDRHDDYDDVVYDEDTFIPQNLTDLLIESEQGPEVVYYLATHQDEAKKLADASPVAAARAIGRLEVQLQAEQAAAEKAPPKESPSAEEAEAEAGEEPPAETQPPAQPARTQTKAPEPISTVGGGGAGATRDPSKMGQEEYEEARRTGRIK